jgi:hypothetical protein
VLCGGFVQAFFRTAGDEDPGALAGQADGNALADAGGGTGDEGDLVFE